MKKVNQRRTCPHEPLLLLADCSALTEGAGPGLQSAQGEVELGKMSHFFFYLAVRAVEVDRGGEVMVCNPGRIGALVVLLVLAARVVVVVVAVVAVVVVVVVLVVVVGVVFFEGKKSLLATRAEVFGGRGGRVGAFLCFQPQLASCDQRRVRISI